MEFDIKLTPAQQTIWGHPARFKIVCAGRRFGKTNLAVDWLSYMGLTASAGVGFYVAPTFQQAKDLVWDAFKARLEPLGAKFYENTGEIDLPNGRKIQLKGADRPDTLRGNKLFGAVVDEYADMKPNVFESIIRPALADLRGKAIIIGTPKGKNHFYNLFERAKSMTGWATFHFTTYDNPFIDRAELEEIKGTMSTFFFEQEHMALFKVTESHLFKESWIIKDAKEPAPYSGMFLVSMDLAGFTDFAEQSKQATPNLDDSAISTVHVAGQDWWVKDIESGRWTTQGNATRVIRAAKLVDAGIVGVEKGVLFQALYPSLLSTMQKEDYVVDLRPLTHGNTNKIQRILWALQGKLEHGRIRFNPGPYLDKFLDQLLNIPSTQTRDDLPDSLAMIEQLAPLGSLVTAADAVSSYLDGVSDTDY